MSHRTHVVREREHDAVPVARRFTWLSAVLAALFTFLLCAVALPAANAASALPDHRAYELVTRYEEGGREVGLGLEADLGIPSSNGEAFDWAGLGACCGAPSNSVNLFQSYRQGSGWQTKALTPASSEELDGLFELQAPMAYTRDLRQTIWATLGSYDSGDQRPPRADKHDLYLQGPTGTMTWLSQGPAGTGQGRYGAEFDAATPDASEVVFSSAEQLTANATGLAELNQRPQYLYVRNVGSGTTTLVNVNDAGALINPYGAAAGNGAWLDEDLIPSNYEGTTTNAISADGTKVFFETPPPGHSAEIPREEDATHLYMRDLATATTTPLDDPNSPASAQYEGASEDGSLVFFTVSTPREREAPLVQLYAFNTTASEIGPIPAMSAYPITSVGAGIVGVSAIANDGSHVFFVAAEALATNANPLGRTAVAGEPNLYDYDTDAGSTTFIATLAPPDVNRCSRTCGEDDPSGLVSEPDISRPVYPTPNGHVLVFGSTAAVTSGYATPSTRLTSTIERNASSLTVESTAGFRAGATIGIDTGANEELAVVEAVASPTELTLSAQRSLVTTHAAGSTVTELVGQYYRYAPEENSLVCITCTPAGVTPTGTPDLGVSGGGTYAPPGDGVAMNEAGSEIFFDSPDALLPGVQSAPSTTGNEPDNVYEWEKGGLSLISDGSSIGSVLDGTTPSGNDVFFATRAALVPGSEEGYEHIYDARVDGGFPAGAPTTPPCEGSDCRGAAAGSTPFSAVAGSETLGGDGSLASPASPLVTYAIGAISAAQRGQLARTGTLKLRVSASAAGDIVASVTAKLRGKTQSVARAEADLEGSGSVVLTLHLSRAARRQLARASALALRIEVSYSASPVSKLAQLTIHQPTKAAAHTGRHRSHA